MAEQYTGTVDKSTILSEDWGSEDAQWTGADVQKGLKAVISSKSGYTTIYKKYVYTFASEDDYKTWVSLGNPSGSSLILSKSDAIKLSEISKTGSLSISYDNLDLIVSGSSCSLSGLVFKGTYFDTNDKELTIGSDTWIEYTVTAVSSTNGSQSVYSGVAQSGVTQSSISLYKFLIDNEAVTFIIKASFTHEGQTISGTSSTAGLVKSSLSIGFASQTFWKTPIYLTDTKDYSEVNLNVVGGKGLNVYLRFIDRSSGSTVLTLTKQMDGDASSSQPFTINPSNDLSGMSHGVYLMLVYVTLTLGSTTVESAKISKNVLVLTSASDTENFICANLSQSAYTNYTSPQVLQFVINTNSSQSADKHFSVVTALISEPSTGTRTSAIEINATSTAPEMYTYSTNISLDTTNNPVTSVVSLSAACTDGTTPVLFTESFSIDNTTQFNAADPTASALEFELDPSIQTIKSDIKNSALKSSDDGYRVSTTWNNLIWGDNEGWITDTENNLSILKLSNGSSMVLNNNIFSTAAANNAMTFEIMYKITSTLDSSEPCVLCFLEGDGLYRGLKIYPDLIDFRADSTTYSDLRTVKVSDEEIIHLTIVCYPDYYNWGLQLVKIYVNGKIAREMEQGFNKFDSALTIGSNSADIAIYKIRKYNSAFNDSKVLANYLNCMTDAESRIKINSNNQIYSFDNDKGGNETGIQFENIVKDGQRALFNCFVLYSPSKKPGDLPDVSKGASATDNCVLPRFGDTDKKWCPDAEISLYWDGDLYAENTDCTIKLNSDSSALQYQGSSSSYYFRYNWRSKFSKGCKIYDRSGTLISENGKLTFYGPVGKVKASILTAKKNYASSMQSHKLGNCLGYQAVYDYLCKAGNYTGVNGSGTVLCKDTLASDIKQDKSETYVATWLAPMLGFVKVKQADGSFVYRYVGLYTIGPDKGDKQMTGFDVDTYPNFFEVEGSNQSPRFTNFAVPWKDAYISSDHGESAGELFWYNYEVNDEVESANDNWEVIKTAQEDAETSTRDDQFVEEGVAVDFSSYIVTKEYQKDAESEKETITDIKATLQAALADHSSLLAYLDTNCPNLFSDVVSATKISKDVVVYTYDTYTYTTTIAEDGTLNTHIVEVDNFKNYRAEFIKRFKNLYKFVFKNSINIHYYNGSVEKLMTETNSGDSSLDPYFAYWSVQDTDNYKLYLYDAVSNHYDVIRQDDDTEDMNVKDLVAGAIASGINATDYDSINEYIKTQHATSFKAGWTSYFNDKDTMIWYMNVILNAGTDERAKNIYPYIIGSENDYKMRWRIDDTDTRQDVDNEGKPIKKYWIELGDQPTTSGIEWKTDSVLFNLLGHDVFFDERREALYNTLTAMIATSDAEGTSKDADMVIKFYDKYFWQLTADYFPEQAYNKDAYFSYDQARYFLDSGGSIEANVNPLTQSLGDHKLGDRLFMKDRINYLMSKYTIMAYAKGGTELISVPRTFHTVKDLELTFNKWTYPMKQEGDEVANSGVRVKKGDVYKMSIAVGDSNGAIGGASIITDFGDLSQTYVLADTNFGAEGDVSAIDPVNFDGLNLIQTIKIGGASTHFNTDLSCKECPNLRVLNMTNCTGVNGQKDLLASSHIEQVLANNTKVSKIWTADGAPITNLELPKTVLEIYINNLSKLTGDSLKINGIAVNDTTEDGYNEIYRNVEGLLVRNTNNSTDCVDGLEILLHILDAQNAIAASDSSYTPALSHFYIDGFNTTFKSEDADTKLALLTTISKGYQGYSITTDGNGRSYYAPNSSDCKMSGSILVKAYYRLNDYKTLISSISNSSNLSVEADSNYDAIINFKDATFLQKLYNFMILEDSSYSNFVDSQTKLNWYANLDDTALDKMKKLCNSGDGTINDRNGNIIIESILKKNVIPYLSGSKVTNSPMYAAIKGLNESIAVSGITDLSDWGTWFENSYPRFLVNHECTGLKLNVEYTSVSDFPLSSIVSSNGTIDTLSVHSEGKLTVKGSSNSTLNATNIKFAATGILKFDETAFSTLTNVTNLYINSEAGLPDYTGSYTTDMNPDHIKNIYINSALYWSYIGSTAGWAYRITRYGDKFIPYNFNTNKVTEIPTNPNQVLANNAIFFNQSVIPVNGTVNSKAVRFYSNSVFEIQFNTSISRPYSTLYFYICGTEAAYVYINTSGSINFFSRTDSQQGSTTGTTVTSTMKVNTVDTYDVICDLRNGSMIVTDVTTGATETLTTSRTTNTQTTAYPILLGSYNKYTSGGTLSYDAVENVIVTASPYMGNIFSFKLWTNGANYDDALDPALWLVPMKTDDGDVYFRNSADNTSTDEYKDILVLAGKSNTLQYNSATV